MSEYGVQGGIRIDDTGTILDVVKVFTISVNPPSIAANSTADVDTALTAGTAAAGDVVIAVPPNALEAGLLCQGASIPSTDSLRLRLSNVTAAAIDGAARTWTVLLVRTK